MCTIFPFMKKLRAREKKSFNKSENTFLSTALNYIITLRFSVSVFGALRVETVENDGKNA